jgi:transposase InsO family protein
VKTIHVHAGSHTSDLRQLVQFWSEVPSSATVHSPVRSGQPVQSDLAILIPRPEVSPITLALYLLSNIPFGILVPVDLLDQTYSPNLYPDAPSSLILEKFKVTGKLTILSTQMTWIIGNIPTCTPVETFSTILSTSDQQSSSHTFEDPIPQSIEDWIDIQKNDTSFQHFFDKTEHAAIRNGLSILACPNKPPLILVPRDVREHLVRFTHKKMFHLGAEKVSSYLKKQYFWPTLVSDTRKFLTNCPDCELEKARQASAHGLFSARPFDAPRSRWAMDFQGQGKAISGETEALALIDTTARYVIVLPLVNREAKTFIRPFLDNLVFIHGPPAILHSDAAPEFLSDALRLLVESTGISTTTTLGHAANANGTIEVFWRFWNRCMRILPDDHYLQWPAFSSRICYAYNSAAHSSLGGISPFEMYYGVPARDSISSGLYERALDDELMNVDLEDPAAFAIAVKTSTTAFSRLAKSHTDYIRQCTADHLNLHGSPRSYSIGDKVKVRVPPTHEQMIQSGRRSSHISSWRGPCTISERMSSTSYKMIEDSTDREFERVVSNILPYRATSARSAVVHEPVYSDPFVISEIIAIRDEPGSQFFLAKVVNVTEAGISVHYFGCTSHDISKAVFRPAWHRSGSDEMKLSITQPNGTIPYIGTILNDSLSSLLIARNLEFTSANRLRRKSQHVIAPVHDELFVYNR